LIEPLPKKKKKKKQKKKKKKEKGKGMSLANSAPISLFISFICCQSVIENLGLNECIWGIQSDFTILQNFLASKCCYKSISHYGLKVNGQSEVQN
jgi:hypothetical protein